MSQGSYNNDEDTSRTNSTFNIPINADTPPSWSEYKKEDFGYEEFAQGKIQELYNVGYAKPLLRRVNEDKEPIYLASSYGALFLWNPRNTTLELFEQQYTFTGIKCLMNNPALPRARMKTMEVVPPEKILPPTEADRVALKDLPKDWNSDMDFESDNFCFSIRAYQLPDRVPLLSSGAQSGDANTIFRCGDQYYLWNDIGSYLFHIYKPKTLREICRRLNDHGPCSLTMRQIHPPPLCEPFQGEDVPPGWSLGGQEYFCMEELSHSRLQALALYGVVGGHRAILSQSHGDGMKRYIGNCNGAHFLWDPAADTLYHIDEPRGLQWILNIMKEDGGSTAHLKLSLIEVEEKRHGVEKGWKSGSKKKNIVKRLGFSNEATN